MKRKEVVIARSKTPAAKLVAIGRGHKRRIPGKFKGQLSIRPSAFDPMTPAELKEWGIE